MNKFGTLALASIVAVTSVLPVAAQVAYERVGNETALEMAQRTGICGPNGSPASASFIANGAQLRAVCTAQPGAALAGGLNAGAVAAGVVAVALVAAAASGGGSSSTTTTPN
ncbi:MAG: hypothetical protein H5U15_08105 [Roseovarius sp.]|jgi:hypothetical protein|nr:hypothetical protein [Roseovarius sp.]